MAIRKPLTSRRPANSAHCTTAAGFAPAAAVDQASNGVDMIYTKQ